MTASLEFVTLNVSEAKAVLTNHAELRPGGVRHSVDPSHPPARHRRIAPLGAAPPPRCHRLPAIDTYRFDFGPVVLTGTPPAEDGARDDEPPALCPRRIVLDQLLLDAAREAGAEVREEFSVQDLVYDGDRVAGIRGRGPANATTTVHARLVIGADGAHSTIAALVAADLYRAQPMLAGAYYSYWSGAPVRAASWAIQPDRGFRRVPHPRRADHDPRGLAGGHSFRQSSRTSRPRTSVRYTTCMPSCSLVLAKEERVVGGGCANHFRTAAGPGWALVGDARYLKDPVTAQGISDAFLDAEHCSRAVHEWLSSERGFDEAMATYQRVRDEHVWPLFQVTTRLATLEPPPEPMQQLLGAAARNQHAMDMFAGVFAGTVSPATFLAPDHVASLVGHA